MREINLYFKIAFFLLVVCLGSEYVFLSWKRYVVPFLDIYLVQSPVVDFFFLCFFGLGILTFVERDYRSLYGRDVQIFLCFVFIGLSIIRFFHPIYFGSKFNFLTSVYYLDVLLFLILVLLIKGLTLTKSKSVVSKNEGLRNLVPVKSSIDDSLGYVTYAKKITAKILESDFNEAFAIGITGRWGSGKTSFSNLLERQLQMHQDVLIVKFKPWVNSDSKGIISEFFSVLEREVSGRTIGVSKKLKKYVDILLQHNSDFKLFSPLVSLNNSSIDAEYELLSREFVKLDKKVFVFIDDIDRLVAEEIQALLKLIRNTANFPNVCYVVNYDRVYVLNSLQRLGVNNPGLFLEKIFSLEISLPFYNKSILHEMLGDELLNYYPKDYHALINEEFKSNASFNINYGDKLIVNIRDVHRLMNSLYLNTKEILGDVYIHDLLQVEILRIKFPEVYDLIRMKRGGFIAQNFALERRCYELIYNKIGDCHLVSELISSNCYTSESLELLDLLLKSLFYVGKSESIEKVRGWQDSIIYPSKFDRYFSYRMSDEDFSTYLFSIARAKDEQAIEDYIRKCLRVSNVEDLKHHLRGVDDFENSKDLNIVLSAVFTLMDWIQGQEMHHFSFDWFAFYFVKFSKGATVRNNLKDLTVGDIHENLSGCYMFGDAVEVLIFNQFYKRKDKLLYNNCSLLRTIKEKMFPGVFTTTQYLNIFCHECFDELGHINDSNFRLFKELFTIGFYIETLDENASLGVVNSKADIELKVKYLDLLSISSDFCLFNSLVEFKVVKGNDANERIYLYRLNNIVEFELFQNYFEFLEWLGRLKVLHGDLVNLLYDFVSEFYINKNALMPVQCKSFDSYVKSWFEEKKPGFLYLNL